MKMLIRKRLVSNQIYTGPVLLKRAGAMIVSFMKDRGQLWDIGRCFSIHKAYGTVSRIWDDLKT